MYRPGLDDIDTDEETYDGGTVRYEELSTETYDITVLSASSFAALASWLDENGFAHSAIDDAVFQEYVGEGAWFVAVRVHPPEGHDLALEPIAVTWPGETLPLTHQLQYDPRGGLLVTDALVLAPERRDAADGTAFTEYAAPVEPTGALAGFGLASGWLTRLSITRQVDEALPDTTLVPAGAEVVRPTIERSTTVRIPGPCCGGFARRFVHTRTHLASESPPIPMSFLTPPSACRRGGCAVGGADANAIALAAIGLLALGLVWRGRTIARRTRTRPRHRSDAAPTDGRR